MSLRLFLFGFLIAAVSGAAALGHELLWTRRLIDLLGGSSEANTRVLSLFFFGLSLGAIGAKRLLNRIDNSMLGLGIAEILIGISTLPLMYLPNLTGWMWPALGPERLAGFEGTLLKSLVSILVILPPAIAMGTTLPLLLAAICKHEGALGREGVWTYAINTAGGVVGLLTVVAVALPSLGADGTMRMLAAVNVALGFVCIALSRLEYFRTPSSIQADLSPAAIPTPAANPTLAANSGQHVARTPLLLAFVSGFGLLACEVIALQAIMLVVPLSYHGPMAILGTVVALLAVAAVVTTYASKRSISDVKHWLRHALRWGGLAAVLSPIWYMGLMSSIPLGMSSTVLGFALKISLLVLVSFGLLFFFLGLVFPLSMILFEKHSGESIKQGAWCQLLAVNGIGGLLGAEFSYRVLLPLLGVHVSLATVGLIYLSITTYLTWKWFPEIGLRVATLAVGAVITLSWVKKLPHMNPNLPFRVLSQQVGADGLVAVVEGEGPGRAIIVANQYILGSEAGQYSQRRQTHLPLMLHPDPRKIGFIGLATGISPGAALRHPEVEEIVVAEISRGVVLAANRFFSDINDGVTRNPKAKVFIEDGRTLVAASPNQFDVLVGDLFLPWGTGASRLYSVEHFQAARDSLRPGGLFCQWLPMYQLTEPQFETVLRTYQQVFPRTYLFRNSASPLNPTICLIGFQDAELSWETVKNRCADTFNHATVEDPAMRHWELLAMHFLGEAAIGPNEDPLTDALITLDNLWLEIDASRVQVTQGTGRAYTAGKEWIRFIEVALPKLIIKDQDDHSPAETWRMLGFEVMFWELEYLEYLARLQTDSTDNRELLGRKQKILQRFTDPMLQSILNAPRAWSGSIELFRKE